jgi:hypothetical protein
MSNRQCVFRLLLPQMKSSHGKCEAAPRFTGWDFGTHEAGLADKGELDEGSCSSVELSASAPRS